MMLVGLKVNGRSSSEGRPSHFLGGVFGTSNPLAPLGLSTIHLSKPQWRWTICAKPTALEEGKSKMHEYGGAGSGLSKRLTALGLSTIHLSKPQWRWTIK